MRSRFIICVTFVTHNYLAAGLSASAETETTEISVENVRELAEYERQQRVAERESTSMYTYILIFHLELMNLYDALLRTPPLKGGRNHFKYTFMLSK